MLRNLAAAVRHRQISARELVSRSVERIERLDPPLGAVVATRGEEALAEAAAVDARIARGEDHGPLAGVPFLIKDIEGLRGAVTTHGSALFRDAPTAERDGAIPARLRAAGAIAVGKTNTPEFAAEAFTTNLVFGTTRNPWAPEWSPGGSSGGSGGALAAGMVPIATATDTGGSIRIPAAFCGLIGLKPTHGVVAWDPALCWPDLTTCGPLGVDVDDLRLLLKVQGSPSTEPPAGPRPRRVVAVPRFFPWGPLPKAVERLFSQALEGLERDLRLAVEPRDPERLLHAGNPEDDWVRLAAPELVAWLGRDRAEGSLEKMFPTTRAFVEAGLRRTLDDYLGAHGRRGDYARELEDVLGDDAVIASPALASEGWRADGTMPGSGETPPPPDVYNLSPANLSGLPAISIPAGRLPNGLPFGLQLIGPRFSDPVLLDLAEEWQRARPWPRAADGYEPFDA